MKALTLHQPYASLIALGVKRIETRSWATKHRGPLAIHAGKSIEGAGLVGAYRMEPWFDNVDHHPFACYCEPGGITPECARRGADRSWVLTEAEQVVATLPLGAIVATATLVDCVPMVSASSTEHNGRHRLFVGETKPVLYRTAERGPAIDVSDQLPYGDFAPGRYAWLLDDIAPTTDRCPACEGIGIRVPRHAHQGQPALRCSVCDGAGRRDPIPAKGKQGLWTWEHTPVPAQIEEP